MTNGECEACKFIDCIGNVFSWFTSPPHHVHCPIIELVPTSQLKIGVSELIIFSERECLRHDLNGYNCLLGEKLINVGNLSPNCYFSTFCKDNLKAMSATR